LKTSNSHLFHTNPQVIKALFQIFTQKIFERLTSIEFQQKKIWGKKILRKIWSINGKSGYFVGVNTIS